MSQPQGSDCVRTGPIHDAPENPSANGRKDETTQPQPECQTNPPTQYQPGRTAIPKANAKFSLSECHWSPHCHPTGCCTPCRSMSPTQRIAGIHAGTMRPGRGFPVARLEASTTRSAHGAMAVRPAACSSEHPQLGRATRIMPARPRGPRNSGNFTQDSRCEPGDFA